MFRRDNGVSGANYAQQYEKFVHLRGTSRRAAPQDYDTYFEIRNDLIARRARAQARAVSTDDEKRARYCLRPKIPPRTM